MTSPQRPSKYALYELSVQSPEQHIEMFHTISKEIRGKELRRLREDFCGTFWLCCEWSKEHPKNRALGLDLDPEPLAYGKQNHWSQLTESQKKRVQTRRADVLISTTAKHDLIVACNFSFNIFKQRKTLLRYFKSCLASLSREGLLILEVAGGPGMIASSREQKTLKLKGQKFTYIWDQKSFDPITHDAFYAIHFKFPKDKPLKNAFTYDWRLWTLPELQDLLSEAGFSSAAVYWETSHKGEGTGEYVRMKSGDNAYAWVAYLVGVK